MFLREYHRTMDGKRHTCFVLVESQRTERGPRQRIATQLGERLANRQRLWRRTANAEQAERLATHKLTLPEHLCADRDVTDAHRVRLPADRIPPRM
ncbi:MAG: hypothetical protein HY763_15850 [Planctomycetes bacterium]|nr:hypothetical protein [Planctomycetota bacterium]